MKTIIKSIVIVALCLFSNVTNAQNERIEILGSDTNQTVESLKKEKETFIAAEKEQLKKEIITINERQDSGLISSEEAQREKEQVAKKHALNIKNQSAIIDNKIQLIERNINEPRFDFGFIELYDNTPKKKIKYDKRTTDQMVFGIGFNAAIIEGESLNDSPYKLGGSGYVELGWAWKTRLLKESNLLRLKYGLSFTWNKLKLKDNKYLVNNDGQIELEDYPINADKIKFRTTNLIFPVHLEIGASDKIETADYVRYKTHKKFKFGIGGFFGFNIQDLQKIKFETGGDKEKLKLKNRYNTNDLVYGLSSYVSWGDTALFVRYDLNPIFNNQEIDQNNIAVGLRFDM